MESDLRKEKTLIKRLPTEDSSSASSSSIRSSGSNSAFRNKVLANFIGLENCLIPSCVIETVDACHIVPHREKAAMFVLKSKIENDGVDDVRNGILLCKEHHDGFDLKMKMLDFSDESNQNDIKFREKAFTIMEEGGRYFVYKYSDGNIVSPIKKGEDVTDAINSRTRTVKSNIRIASPDTFKVPHSAFLNHHNEVSVYNIDVFGSGQKS